MEPKPITSFFHEFERDKITGAISEGVDGVGRLLIVASKKVGGDEGIFWVFILFYFYFLVSILFYFIYLSQETEMRKWHKSSILLK